MVVSSRREKKNREREREREEERQGNRIREKVSERETEKVTEREREREREQHIPGRLITSPSDWKEVGILSLEGVMICVAALHTSGLER